jgi:hypothetical protein
MPRAPEFAVLQVVRNDEVVRDGVAAPPDRAEDVIGKYSHRLSLSSAKI